MASDAEAAASIQVEEAAAVLQKKEADLQTKRDELNTAEEEVQAIRLVMVSAEQIQAASLAVSGTQQLGAALARIRTLVWAYEGLAKALESIEAATQPPAGAQIPPPHSSQPIFGWSWPAQEMA